MFNSFRGAGGSLPPPQINAAAAASPVIAFSGGNGPSMQETEKSLGLLADLIARAARAGADAADAVLVEGVSLSLCQRLGEPESVDRAGG